MRSAAPSRPTRSAPVQQATSLSGSTLIGIAPTIVSTTGLGVSGPIDITLVGRGMLLTSVQLSGDSNLLEHTSGVLALERLTLEQTAMATTIPIGGLLHMRNDAELRATEVRFLGGYAHDGGALAFDGSARGSLVDVVFNDNMAESRGGALYILGNSEVAVAGATFRDNSALEYGGGITHDATSLFEVRRSVFESNLAGAGGALDYSTASLGGRVENCVFDDNRAFGPGGAILHAASSEVTVSYSSFRGNLPSALLVSHAGTMSLVGNALEGAGPNTFCESPMAGSFTSDGFNIASDDDVMCQFGPSDLITNPLIGDPLVDISVGRSILAPYPESPVIGFSTGGSCPSVDARGLPREGDTEAGCAAGAYEPVPPANPALVGYWMFESSSSGQGIAEDFSGAGHDASLVDDQVFGPGVLGRGAQLGAGQAITVPGLTASAIGAASFTVFACFDSTQPPGNGEVLMQVGDTDGTHVRLLSDAGSWAVTWSNGGGTALSPSPVGVSDDLPHCFALVHDRLEQRLKVYVDGDPASDFAAQLNPLSGEAPLMLGGGAFEGVVDEGRVWLRAVDEPAIKVLP